MSFLLLAAPIAVLGIPGSFGRYLEHYRQRNQLRSFLRRTTLGTSALVAIMVTTVVLAAPYFSNLIFGRPDKVSLVLLVAGSILAVILHHFLEAVFAGLRMFRVVSAMQFCQSMGFATAGVLLLSCWRLDAYSIVLAYGGACLASSCGAILWARGAFAELSPDAPPPTQSAFWSKLMRFAFWIWLTNVLANLFAVVDRYMIVHFGGLDSQAALVEVGHYHSSRIVPLLLISVADLLAGIVLPYMSHEWESGRRREVSRLLNFMLKLTALGMLLCGTLVLVISPLLFDYAFEGKYDGGLAVLPMTLAYCTWFGLFVVAQNYLWCAEKTRLATLPLGAALIANVVLNLVLLPRYGLMGAVLGTTLANGVCLGLTLLLCRYAGMRFDFASIVLCAAPAALCGGTWVAIGMTSVLGLALLTNESLFSIDERERFSRFIKERLGRFRRDTSQPAQTSTHQ